MNHPLSLWRRLWASLPLTYKLVLFGLCTIMTATLAVMVVTYTSAGDSLKLQLERQVSRDLNVLETWYRTRLEEMQLTSVGLVRHDELATAIAERRLAPAAALLQEEQHRLQVDLALLVDDRGRVLTLTGEAGPFDPKGIVQEALSRREQIVGTEAWSAADVAAALPGDRRPGGLVRLVVTPVSRDGRDVGALVIGEWVDGHIGVPKQVTSMIGGAIGLLDTDRIVVASGFPTDQAPRLPEAVWQDVRAGRYFFAEQTIGNAPYLLAFRPLIDHEGRTVGAFVRGFPESDIAETLHRYAGGIFLLSAAAVVFSLLAFLWLTRQLLFPLRRLASISMSLAEGDEGKQRDRPWATDELGRLERGVATMADRLTQSREELAEAAVKLEVEAQQLAERNAQLARLNEENARLLAAIRDHDRLRGQLIEKIITAQEDERKRIARELHDETGQSLTGLLVGLKYVEGATTLEAMRDRTADLKALAVKTLEEVHKLSVALRPAMLDDLGLVVTVRSLVKDFGQQVGVKATLTVDHMERRLPPLWEVTLYRIVQEALTNVGKYADAKHVTVKFALVGDQLTASISDDGVGFEPGAIAKDGREHLGLLGMQERIALIGGEFRLKTAPGEGTCIEVTARLPEGAPALAGLDGGNRHG